MADSIRIKAGKGSVPTLQDREIAYSKDEKAIYIGTPEGNVKLCDAELEARIKAYIDGLVANINARLDALHPPTE